MTKLAQEYAAKALKTRSYLGTAKVCANCGTCAHPDFRKCINPRCKGGVFRAETSAEGNARLNAYDADQSRLQAAAAEFGL